MDNTEIKKTLIFPKRLDNVLRIQSAIKNISQGELIVNILTDAIDPKLYDLLDEPTPRDAIAASEKAPTKK
ncbi:MAG TPA: hypothetical protein VFC84_14780 [Desulfosporosinus sp.]|nr:hypothetical protein [Desulfosporosinus sp.]